MGLSAGTTAYGLSMLPGLPVNMVVGLQKQVFQKAESRSRELPKIKTQKLHHFFHILLVRKSQSTDSMREEADSTS